MKKVFLILGFLGFVTVTQAMEELGSLIDRMTVETIKNKENMSVIKAMHILSKAGVLDDIMNKIQNQFLLNEHNQVIVQNQSLAQRFRDIYNSQVMIGLAQECEEEINKCMMNMVCNPIKKKQFEKQYLDEAAKKLYKDSFGGLGVQFVNNDTIKQAYVENKKEVIAAYFRFTPWFIRRFRQLYVWMKSVKPQLKYVSHVDNRVCLLILNAALGDCLTLCDRAIALLMQSGNVTQETLSKFKRSVLCFGVMLSMGYYTQELKAFIPGFVEAKKNLQKSTSVMNNQPKKFQEQYDLFKDAYEYVFDLALKSHNYNRC